MISVLLGAMFLSILGSFYFAGTETGFVSWNPIKARQTSKKGGLFLKAIPHLLENREQVLGTVLIGNNISIVSASIVFEKIVEYLNHQIVFDLYKLPSLELLVLTPFMVIFTEMLPKSLFRIYSFRITMRAIPLLTLFYWLFYPFTKILALLSGSFGKSGGGPLNKERRNEITLVAKEGSRQGTIIKSTEILMENILELKSISVAHKDFSINPYKIRIEKRCTPDDSIDKLKTLGKGKRWDTYPVFDLKKNNVIGYVPIEDILTVNNNASIKSVMTLLDEESQIDGTMSLVTFISKGLGFKRRFYKIQRNGKEKLVSSGRIHQSVFSGS